MQRKLTQMADMCEMSVCRRQKILAYFDEHIEGNCGSCDVCLGNQNQIDGTVIAQKALSAVARFDNNYGLTYLVDFLRGSKSEKIRAKHKTLSTYGIGADLSKDAWFSYIKNLIGLGYLEQSGSEYPVLKLTKKSVAVLNGEKKVMLSESTNRINRPAGASKEIECEANLLAEIKKIRKKLAIELSVPAYLVLSDATLLELATYLPLTMVDIRRISGFGDVKTARYGKKFVDVIKKYCTTNKLATRIDQKVPKRERKK